MHSKFLTPEEIEKKSMEIIEQELGKLDVSEEEKTVIKQVAHASADTEFAKGVIFHPQAITSGQGILRSGGNIVTDVEMVKAGIRKKELAETGNKIYCFVNDEQVLQNALSQHLPRAVLAMRQAIPYLDASIVVIGNAPTALFELVNLIKEGKISPALVIGTPVGFVGAAESKEALRQIQVPHITNRGRKGGSAVACAIVNALIKLTFT